MLHTFIKPLHERLTIHQFNGKVFHSRTLLLSGKPKSSRVVPGASTKVEFTYSRENIILGLSSSGGGLFGRPWTRKSQGALLIFGPHPPTSLFSGIDQFNLTEAISTAGARLSLDRLSVGRIAITAVPPFPEQISNRPPNCLTLSCIP